MNKLYSIILGNFLLFISSIFVVLKTKGSLPQKNTFIGPAIILFLVIISYIHHIHLYYDIDKIKKGELWRPLTSHITHSTFIHLLFNISGLILIWILYGNHFTTKMFLSLFLTCSLMCSSGILLSGMKTCIGMSGVLMGLFIFGALKDIKSKQKIGFLLLFLLLFKIFREQVFGSNMNEALDMNVAIDVHVYGMFGGIVYFLLQ
jgi:rhomboid family GlyGly-CTERM serine protease